MSILNIRSREISFSSLCHQTKMPIYECSITPFKMDAGKLVNAYHYVSIIVSESSWHSLDKQFKDAVKFLKKWGEEIEGIREQYKVYEFEINFYTFNILDRNLSTIWEIPQDLLKMLVNHNIICRFHNRHKLKQSEVKKAVAIYEDWSLVPNEVQCSF